MLSLLYKSCDKLFYKKFLIFNIIEIKFNIINIIKVKITVQIFLNIYLSIIRVLIFEKIRISFRVELKRYNNINISHLLFRKRSRYKIRFYS